MSLNDLLSSIQQSKVGQAVQGLMDKAKGMFSKEEQGFMAGMPDQKGGFAGVEFGDFGVGQNFAGAFADVQNVGARAQSISDRAAGVFEAHNKARSPAALSPFAAKAKGKLGKAAVNYATLSQMGLPAGVAKEMALAGLMSNPLGAMVGPAFGAVSANFSTQNDLADLAADVAMENPDLSDTEVAEAVHEMSVDAGHEVEMGAIENAMADEWGGGPDAPGEEGSDQEAAASAMGGASTTEGGESDTLSQMMYDMSPLKNYWQTNYGVGSPGFMGGGVYDGQSRAGVYGFRK
jgi:hypothetical protein